MLSNDTKIRNGLFYISFKTKIKKIMPFIFIISLFVAIIFSYLNGYYDEVAPTKVTTTIDLMEKTVIELKKTNYFFKIMFSSVFSLLFIVSIFELYLSRALINGKQLKKEYLSNYISFYVKYKNLGDFTYLKNFIIKEIKLMSVEDIINLKNINTSKKEKYFINKILEINETKNSKKEKILKLKRKKERLESELKSLNKELGVKNKITLRNN